MDFTNTHYLATRQGRVGHDSQSVPGEIFASSFLSDRERQISARTPCNKSQMEKHDLQEKEYSKNIDITYLAVKVTAVNVFYSISKAAIFTSQPLMLAIEASQNV